MVTDDSYTYSEDYFIMCKSIVSLCCTPEMNRILYVNYTSIKEKEEEEEE